MQSTEKWKPVVGYEGLYEVSDLGVVRGVDRAIWDSARKVTRRWAGRVIKGTPTGSGHLLVRLCRSGVPTPLYVHRLVLHAFVGPAPSGHEGCHWDGDPTNNRLDNLRWDTRSGNVHDAVRHGTHRGRH